MSEILRKFSSKGFNFGGSNAAAQSGSFGFAGLGGSSFSNAAANSQSFGGGFAGFSGSAASAQASSGSFGK